MALIKFFKRLFCRHEKLLIALSEDIRGYDTLMLRTYLCRKCGKVETMQHVTHSHYIHRE